MGEIRFLKKQLFAGKLVENIKEEWAELWLEMIDIKKYQSLYENLINKNLKLNKTVFKWTVENFKWTSNCGQFEVMQRSIAHHASYRCLAKKRLL